MFTVAQDVTQVVQACVPAEAARDLQLRLQSVVSTLMQSAVRALTRSDGATSVQQLHQLLPRSPPPTALPRTSSAYSCKSQNPIRFLGVTSQGRGDGPKASTR